MDSESGVEVRPLYFYGEPTAKQREALRKGKELLGVDWLIQPVDCTIERDPMDPVLCFRYPLRLFWGGHALLTAPYTPERMAAALREIYLEDFPTHLTTVVDWLNDHLGPGVKLVWEEEDGSIVKWMGGKDNDASK